MGARGLGGDSNGGEAGRESGDCAREPGAPASALAAARALRAEMPEALATRRGDLEGAEWWERHEGLFAQARREWGALCPDVYRLAPPGTWPIQVLAASRWLRPAARDALLDGSPAALRALLRAVCADSAGIEVYQLDLFTEEFCDALLAELDHLEASGIPMRRPNGMNRYGAILSQLGFQEGLLDPLMHMVVAPLAMELWPEWAGEGDCEETYGFAVRYRLGEDVDLAEHSDTANVTLNLCLGRTFEGGDLYFKGCRFTPSDADKEERQVSHRRGAALLHLGGHIHGVRPLTAGDRSNLILWGTGAGGVVRIRPSTPRTRPPAKGPPKRGWLK